MSVRLRPGVGGPRAGHAAGAGLRPEERERDRQRRHPKRDAWDEMEEAYRQASEAEEYVRDHSGEFFALTGRTV